MASKANQSRNFRSWSSAIFRLSGPAWMTSASKSGPGGLL